MSEKLAEILDNLMTEAHLSAEELARRIGLPASSIKKIRNRDNLNPTISTLSPIAKYFLLSLSQLVGDEPIPATRIKGSYQVNPSTLINIPLISWEEAIKWPKTQSQSHNFVTIEQQYGKNTFALRVIEDNWENLTSGTILIVDPSLSPDHRDFVIIYKKGQQLPTLRQVLQDEDSTFLKSMISSQNIIKLTTEHQFLGVVVEYKKHLKVKI